MQHAFNITFCMSVKNERNLTLVFYFVVLSKSKKTSLKIVVPVVMEMLTRVHEKFILIVVLKCHLLADSCHCTSCRPLCLFSFLL